MTSLNIPDDADGDAMRRVLEDGSDVTLPMDIDFMIACSDTTAAEAIGREVASKGFQVKISVDDDDGSVTCYAMKSMLLEYEALIATQEELDQIAKKHEGYIDGWGTHGNIPE